MNEFLSTLLQAVIIAAIPVCAAFAGKGIRALTAYFCARTDSETARKHMTAAAEAVAKAVAYTSQTFVDTLKKKDAFTKENQEEALKRAVEQAKALLTAEARAFLTESYGDLDDYLKANIEAEVRAQKNAEPLAIGTVDLPEIRENQDVTTVAAATAAATAATTARAVMSQAAASTTAAVSPEAKNSETVAG